MALLVAAAPASAATPVSDQYQSAAPPILSGTQVTTANDHTTQAADAAPTPGGAAVAGTGTGKVATTKSSANRRRPQQPAATPVPIKPIAVTRARLAEPLKATSSNLPFLALGALALLALGLAAAAIGRARRPTATP